VTFGCNAVVNHLFGGVCVCMGRGFQWRYECGLLRKV
jgi:hypothetical protein